MGANVTLEFVDTSGKGEYRMTTDPAKKDVITCAIVHSDTADNRVLSLNCSDPPRPGEVHVGTTDAK